VSFDDAVAELSQAVPAEFVLVRARLEGELRAAGDTEGAAELKRRRRPHLAAWACNQLTHRDPDLLDDLAAVTAEVADAQRAALRGEDADRLRAATRERQEVLDRATSVVVATLKGVAPDPSAYEANIAATLDAASLDPDAATQLRTGVLTKPMRAPATFELVDGASPPPAPKSPARERQQAQREVEQARKDVTDLSAKADELDAEQASAEMHLHSAEVHLADIETALGRAKDNAKAAQQALAQARQRDEDSKKELRQASERLRQAEARLAALADA